MINSQVAIVAEQAEKSTFETKTIKDAGASKVV
jgi:hypothetical protein